MNILQVYKILLTNYQIIKIFKRLIYLYYYKIFNPFIFKKKVTSLLNILVLKRNITLFIK